MSYIAFIRNKTVFDCWDYYESKTDVFLFGDRAGYRLFRTKLPRACSSIRNLKILSKNPNSMRVVILPAQYSRGRSPKLKFVERLVHVDGAPNMELVIAGNTFGYRYFADRISTVIASSQGDVTDHIHFDDKSDRFVVPRSVSLNIRDPLVKWDPKSLGDYAHLVEVRGDYYLPRELGKYRLTNTEEYYEINVEESDFVWI